MIIATNLIPGITPGTLIPDPDNIVHLCFRDTLLVANGAEFEERMEKIQADFTGAIISPMTLARLTEAARDLVQEWGVRNLLIRNQEITNGAFDRSRYTHIHGVSEEYWNLLCPETLIRMQAPLFALGTLLSHRGGSGPLFTVIESTPNKVTAAHFRTLRRNPDGSLGDSGWSHLASTPVLGSPLVSPDGQAYYILGSTPKQVEIIRTLDVSNASEWDVVQAKAPHT